MCLIDIGSQVNLILLKLLTKHGSFLDRAGFQKVQFFDGSEGSINGSLTCLVVVGFQSTEGELEFLVYRRLVQEQQEAYISRCY